MKGIHDELGDLRLSKPEWTGFRSVELFINSNKLGGHVSRQCAFQPPSDKMRSAVYLPMR